MVEIVGTAPTAAILQGSPAPLCYPRYGAQSLNRTNLFRSSGGRVDHDHYLGNLERPTGIEPGV